VQVERYKKTFLTKHNDQSQLAVTEHLYDTLENMRLELDLIVLELCEDINVL